jgi:hypothetical protein
MASEGFSNPVVGGKGVLIRESIHSPNFLTGVDGWTINKDGSVEFNNGVFRGTIVNGGVFVYDGTPATGNLIAALSPTAGTDAFGNQYGKGLTFANPNSPPDFLFIGTNPGLPGQMEINSPAGDIGIFAPGNRVAIASGKFQTFEEVRFGSSVPFTDLQHGTFDAVFSAVATVSGTLTFPNVFSAIPHLQGTVDQLNANMDVALNWQVISATQATWRVFQTRNLAISGTARINWLGLI